jgi:hypothetical protein
VPVNPHIKQFVGVAASAQPWAAVGAAVGVRVRAWYAADLAVRAMSDEVIMQFDLLLDVFAVDRGRRIPAARFRRLTARQYSCAFVLLAAVLRAVLMIRVGRRKLPVTVWALHALALLGLT